MAHNFFANKYLIFLLAFFAPMIISIGGEVSPSFLFIVSTYFFWKKYLDFKHDKILKQFIRLFSIIIAVQVVWIPFAETDLITQIKAVLITVSGLFFFLYYYMVYSYNKDVVKWSLLGTFLSTFVFVNVLAEVAGGEFGMWKFQIMPRLVSMTALIYLWTSSNKTVRKLAPFMFLFVGGLGLVTGARSCGLSPFMAGAVCLMVQLNGVKLKNLKKYVIGGAVSLYAMYALVYVPNVLNGNITGGNTEQLKAVENPYNPLNLLMVGRTDSIVPFIAFLDNPITGWGYFTSDPNFKYHLLNNKLQSGDSSEGYQQDSSIRYNIPGHSVWGYYSCSYGIIVFFVLFLFLRKTWGLLFRSLTSRDEYLQYRIFAIFGLTWNFIFSPISHFKTLPMTMALIVVFSVSAIKYQKLIDEKI
ncbi:MAG: hypothetical protein NC548_28725 [Lachnospiraceae bacterium]|nr:hypothetical protein [Lachnospiraceae bacterium]